MKKLLIILFSLIHFSLGATKYYVAPLGGSDSNTGGITTPWATWQKAFTTAVAGDTVYFRDGVWYINDDVAGVGVLLNNKTGTHDNPICFFNYPGEVPIIDFVNIVNEASTLIGLNITNCTNIKFRGLTVRNRKQTHEGTEWVAGIASSSTGADGNLCFENMNSYGHGGAGYFLVAYDTLSLINCDSHDNCDTLSTGLPGGRADGYTLSSQGAANALYKYTYVTGCRAWNNSDDGYDFGTTKQIQADNNWSWGNGRYDGDGNGFKLSFSYVLDTHQRRFRNNIAAGCSGYGFQDANLQDAIYGPFAEYSNNTIYKCQTGFNSSAGEFNCDTPGDTGLVVMRNNIVYNSTYAEFDQTWLYACNFNFPSYTIQHHNTWRTKIPSPYWQYNDSVTVTDIDFYSLDTAQLRGSRYSDNSLPSITAFHLVPTSDLKSKGINLGMSAVPDMGIDWAYLLSLSGSGRFLISSSGKLLKSNGKFLISNLTETPEPNTKHIIADHSIVDRYDDIPQRWIDSVKTKLIWILSMSHGYGYMRGADLLMAQNDFYMVDTYNSVPAPEQTAYNLRLGRPETSREHFYTDASSYTIYEEDYFKHQYEVHNNAYDVVWFGWSYQATWENGLGGGDDPIYNVQWAGSSTAGPDGNLRWGLNAADYAQTANSVSMDTYIAAVKGYQAYCTANSIPTSVIYSTGAEDGNSGSELGFQRELKWQYIRDTCTVMDTVTFIDYADILDYNNAGELNTVDWNDGGIIRPHRQIHPDNLMDYDEFFNIISPGTDAIEDHIGEVGALRLAKAMWWMLARMAGWDGN